MKNDEIEELVAEFVELKERGEAIDPASWARRHPELEHELLAALAALEETDALLPAPSGDLPSRVGPYRVLGEIGRGGMGRVLRVTSPAHPGGDLALKLLHPVSAFDPRSAERFRREGEVLKTLQHENIVRIHEVGLFGASPYLVMDRVEGRSLSQVIHAARAKQAARQASPADRLDLPGEGSGCERAARLVARLARAVAAVHRAGALHRDVKPGNVILREDGTPVLVDFGMVHQSGVPTLTRTGDLLGTPQYMPPEQARGERTDERADVYGLGGVLYELLTLEPPHVGNEPLEVLDRVRSLPVKRVRRLAPSVPRALERIAHRALAYRVRWRTAGAEDLALDLEAFLEGRAIAASPPSVAERFLDLWTFHKRPLVAAALILLLGLGVVLARERWIDRQAAASDESFDAALRAWIDKDAQAAAVLARDALARREDHAWAAFLLALAEARDPSGFGDPSREAAAAGWRKHRSGEHAQAVEDFERAVELAPGAVLPVLLLGLEAQHAGDLERAQRELSAALRLLPGSAGLQEHLGNAFYGHRDFRQALDAFEAVLESEPLRADLWEQVARTRFRLSDHVSGLAAAERARELAGENPSYRILYTLGALLDIHKRHAEARVVFEQAAKLAPDGANPAMSIASTLDSEHRAREAEDAYWEAAQLGHPGKPLIYLAYMYAGAKSAECEGCQRVYRENPDLLDPERAESCALGALDADGGREPGLPLTAAQVAKQIGRPDRIRTKLEELKEGAEKDELIARYERALRMLRER